MQNILSALKGHDKLIDVLKYLIDQCNGNLVFDDGRSQGLISELTVYSECFTKDQLDVLFQYADYRELSISKGKMRIRLSLDI